MKTKELTFIFSSVDELPKDLYQKAYSLNMRSFGRMRGDLVCAKQKWNKANVSMILENGKLLAWSMLSNLDHEKEIAVYVRKTERNKGFATFLVSDVVKNSQEQAKNVLCFPWDLRSDRFFDRLQFKIERA